MATDAPPTEVAAPVLVEHRDGISIITINRPQARNALDQATALALAAAFDELDDSPSVAVGILTGAGGSFCAGMDLKAFLRGERPGIPGRGLGGLTERPPAKPIIAAVEGYALAGGCEMALGCDLIVAAETAKFGIPESKRGLVAAGGGLLRLPKRIPYHVAMELALTGDPIDARRAYELGLVNVVTPEGGALAGAIALAGRVAGNGPLALKASKYLVRHSFDWAEDDGFDAQRELCDSVLTSEDAREGAAAFAQKRPPVWQGK